MLERRVLFELQAEDNDDEFLACQNHRSELKNLISFLRYYYQSALILMFLTYLRAEQLMLHLTILSESNFWISTAVY